MTAKILTLAVALTLLSFGTILGQSIVVDHVDGLNAMGNIDDGAVLTFHMRITGDADPHMVISNGFEISSPDGLTWTSVSGELNPIYPWDMDPMILFPPFFDLGMYVNVFADGAIADTIGFGGAAGMYGTGLPAGFDDVAYYITVGPITGSNGDFLVLDSSFYPPAGRWVWDIVEQNVAWGGPYQYEFGIGCPAPMTYLSQDPIILKDLADKILTVYIECEDNALIDPNSILVNAKIPPKEYRIEGELFAFDIGCTRFLSNWRPISSDFQGTYTVDYDLTTGEHKTITGDVNVIVYPGDLTFDGIEDQQDIVFLVEYMWNRGQKPYFEEALDVNRDGSVDVLDLRDLVQMIY
ncbi:MAG: dockerin type I domain-containing protein [Candidatus Zixiibacteriota bacterium]